MSNYNIKGRRFVREYTAETKTPTYAAQADATKIASSLCTVPWSSVEGNVPATFPAHSGNTKTDAENVAIRKYFDAALFCGEHDASVHRAFANAACYRFVLPNCAVGVSLTELKAKIFSDPYNAHGARVAVYTSSSPDIPMTCEICRKGSSQDESAAAQTNNGTALSPATEWYSTNTHVEGAVPRITDGSLWYANTGYAFIRPTGGLTLAKYLFVFVLMENYASSRNGYLEGASYSDPKFSITTATAIQDWTDGDTIECIDLNSCEVYYAKPVIGTKTKILDYSGHLEGIETFTGTGYDIVCLYGTSNEYSVQGIPGFIIYDKYNSRKLTFQHQLGPELQALINKYGRPSFYRISNYSTNTQSWLNVNMYFYGAAVKNESVIMSVRWNTESGELVSISESVGNFNRSINAQQDAEIIMILTGNTSISQLSWSIAVSRISTGDIVLSMTNNDNDYECTKNTVLEVGGGEVAGVIEDRNRDPDETVDGVRHYRMCHMIVYGSFKTLGGVSANGFARVDIEEMINGETSVRIRSLFSQEVILDNYDGVFAENLRPIGSLAYIKGSFITINGKVANGSAVVMTDENGVHVIPLNFLKNIGKCKFKTINPRTSDCMMLPTDTELIYSV